MNVAQSHSGATVCMQDLEDEHGGAGHVGAAG
jgi:hypothetical protein